MRYFLALLCLCLAGSGRAQSPQFPAPQFPAAPQSSDSVLTAKAPVLSASALNASILNVSILSASIPGRGDSSSSLAPGEASSLAFSSDALPSEPIAQTTPPAQKTGRSNPGVEPNPGVPLDANGNPVALNRQQPTRILGFMPNFRTVSGGAAAHPPGWKYNFSVATHQATDYSSFIFLGLTSLTAEGMDSHPALGKGVAGFYAYTWRGFLDKSDNTYLSAWLLASALHEDTRYYALGSGHSIPVRALYVISRQGVARTYGGRQTPNLASLGAKVLTQVISRTYYPPSATNFPVLATKFGYSVMRDVGFSAIREFYPDIAAHYIQKHREKAAREAALDAAGTKTP